MPLALPPPPSKDITLVSPSTLTAQSSATSTHGSSVPQTSERAISHVTPVRSPKKWPRYLLSVDAESERDHTILRMSFQDSSGGDAVNGVDKLFSGRSDNWLRLVTDAFATTRQVDLKHVTKTDSVWSEIETSREPPDDSNSSASASKRKRDTEDSKSIGSAGKWSAGDLGLRAGLSLAARRIAYLADVTVMYTSRVQHGPVDINSFKNPNDWIYPRKIHSDKHDSEPDAKEIEYCSEASRHKWQAPPDMDVSLCNDDGSIVPIYRYPGSTRGSSKAPRVE